MTTSIISNLLGALEEAIKLIPDYEQRKKNQYFKLKERYENEKSKEYYERDDNQLAIYRSDLMRFISVFRSEISTKTIPTVLTERD